MKCIVPVLYSRFEVCVEEICSSPTAWLFYLANRDCSKTVGLIGFADTFICIQSMSGCFGRTKMEHGCGESL